MILPCNPHARAHLVLPSRFPHPRDPLVLTSRSCSTHARAHLSLISRSSRAHIVHVSCSSRARAHLVLVLLSRSCSSLSLFFAISYRACLVLISCSCSPRARASLTLISRSCSLCARAHLTLISNSYFLPGCSPRDPLTLVLPSRSPRARAPLVVPSRTVMKYHIRLPYFLSISAYFLGLLLINVHPTIIPMCVFSCLGVFMGCINNLEFIFFSIGIGGHRGPTGS